MYLGFSLYQRDPSAWSLPREVALTLEKTLLKDRFIRLPTYRLSDSEPEGEVRSRVDEVLVTPETPSSPYQSIHSESFESISMEHQEMQQRMLMMEQELQRRKEEADQRHEELQNMLRDIMQTVAGPRVPPPNPENPGVMQDVMPGPYPEESQLTPNNERRSKIRAALPADYDGQRKGGQAFLNSCELYLQLVGTTFTDDQQKIHWVLTFCKSGRAATFADQVLRSERTRGTPKFENWAAFVADFKTRFCESNEQVRALTKLEGDSWYQRTSAVDDYIDNFETLVELAELTTDAGLVMKFRRGLNKDIQDRVAEMQNPPGLTDLEGWKQAARQFHENLEANRAFTRQARTTPNVVPNKGTVFPRPNLFQRPLPSPPMPVNPRPSPFPNFGPKPEVSLKARSEDPVPMDVDSSKQQKAVPQVCYRCQKPGHMAKDCPLRFDVRSMTSDERRDLLDQLLAEADLAQIGSAEIEPEETSDSGF
jgi:hypothetical protein